MIGVNGAAGELRGSLSAGSGQALRWESPALRATPLPQDDNASRGRFLSG
jgi:hypothetical protein